MQSFAHAEAERRQAKDGQLYTLEEFMQYYGETEAAAMWSCCGAAQIVCPLCRSQCSSASAHRVYNDFHCPVCLCMARDGGMLLACGHLLCLEHYANCVTSAQVFSRQEGFLGGGYISGDSELLSD